MEHIKKIFDKQKLNLQSIKDTSTRDRLAKINKIISYIDNNEDVIHRAVNDDLGKSRAEVLSSEIGVLKINAKHIQRHLASWSKSRKVATPLFLTGTSSYIHYEPKGNCLVISPWNYPFFLALDPALYSIAAGNATIIKPSEYAPATSALIKKMMSSLFPENEVAVIEGAVNESKSLLSLPFNHIFFTGSPTVGKIVMTAAAKNLISVTLELGGKSPVIVDETANLDMAAQSISWGKYTNAGQTCIAPDYIMVKDSILKIFLDKLSAAVEKHWAHPLDNPDYAHIISNKHFDRSIEILEDAISKGAKVVSGGIADAERRHIPPTILTHVNDTMKIMQEEIFAPIIPVLSYSSLEEVIRNIEQRPKPLAMYIFSKSKKNKNYILHNSSSGGTIFNDTNIHIGNSNLPFGGVNNSGIGKNGGRYGFIQFSNERAVMKQKLGMTRLLHPPYSPFKEKLIRFMTKYLT